MPSDELDSIPGLEENHRRALASKLGITSLAVLADTDQRAIHGALANIRPRPSLARIAAWQDQARARPGNAPGNGSAWQTAASFAVIFARREVDGGWERRLEAEQTEVEPEPEPRQWPGWDPGPLCDWMLAQLASFPAGPAAAGPSPATPAPAAATPVAPARGARAELRIDSATITDAAGDTDLINGGKPAAAPGDLRQPVRLRFTVTGGRSGQQLRAAVWFRRRAAPGWSPHEPVLVPPSGQAEFDLSPVPPGGHEIRLLAWAADPGAKLAAVTLPELVFAARA